MIQKTTTWMVIKLPINIMNDQRERVCKCYYDKSHSFSTKSADEQDIQLEEKVIYKPEDWLTKPLNQGCQTQNLLTVNDLHNYGLEGHQRFGNYLSATMKIAINFHGDPDLPRIQYLGSSEDLDLTV